MSSQSGWTPEQSGRMRVKVRAVIVDEGRLLVVPERRVGAYSHMTLPGGRTGRWESVSEAFVREVREETGLDVAIGPLLYIAEVTPPRADQDLNLIFLAEPLGEWDIADHDSIDLGADDHSLVLPPIVGQIARDFARGWRGTPRWLGNVWDETAQQRQDDPVP
jgi:ADP-ribose pyrophosphatase YjhB (NUDIX family)